MRLEPRFHVCLKQTSMEDFSNHVLAVITNMAYELEASKPEESWHWRRDVVNDEAISFASPADTRRKITYWSFVDTEEEAWRLLTIVEVGTTYCYWEFVGQDPNADDQPDTILLMIEATHYRCDNLDVVLAEDANANPDEGKCSELLRWLQRHWGEDAISLELGDSDSPTVGRSASTPTHPGTRVYQDSDVRATFVHYLLTKCNRTQRVACDLVGITPKTYRRYRDYGGLLSPEQYRKATGKSLEDEAREVVGDSR